MKVDLEVLASTEIKDKKSKKPWPRTIWIGEEQESLLLLDAPGKRISVLYVPSGKTKKSLSKVSPLAKQAKRFASTRNGRYLLGLLENGELFVWHKDKDVVKFVAGLDKMDEHFRTEICHLDASDECNYILVAVGTSSFLLWIMEKGESVIRGGDTALRGSWHRITIPPKMDLASSESRERSVASVFYDSPSLGHCSQCSLVFNKDAMLCVATLVLKFPDPVESFGKNLPKFSAEWSMLEYPFQQMHAEFEPVSTQGAYISAYSGSGQVLAVAANQRAPSKTTMLFVSPLTDTVLVGGMKNCGTADPNKTGRHYWVADLAWTSDNLFLACMLKNGSVCLIPRLGDPVAIQSQGCSVDMGPARFLPLHPTMHISDNHGSLEPSAFEQDPMQQQLSLATHPTLPIMLFSDGFWVTVAQLPVEMTSVSVMRDLVLESARFLKKLYAQENLDMTVADAHKLSRGQRGSKQNLANGSSKGKGRRPYQFELAEVSLNASAESETSIIETTHKFGFEQFGAIGNMDAGKIVFGEAEMISIDPNATFTGLEASDALLKYLEESMSALTLAWKLAASYPDLWTGEVDNITKQAVHNFCKIFQVVLDCPAVDAIMPVLTPRQSSAIQNPRVYNIIVAYRNILQLLRFDTFNQHLIPAALRLVHKTITLMLSSKELDNSDPKLKTLFGCFSLLKHAETSLNRVYVWVPSESQTGTPSSDGSPRRFEPAVMTKLEKQSTGSSTDLRGVHLDNKGQLPGKRLAATWKLLYKQTEHYQAQVSRAGDIKGEVAHTEKLLLSIEQVLHDSDIQVTPRTAATKLSVVWLRNAFPFDLLSNSDSFMYTDDDQNQSFEPKSTSPSPDSSARKSAGNDSSFFKTDHFTTSTLKNGQNLVSILKNSPNSTINVLSMCSSPDENFSDNNNGGKSPNSVNQNGSLKVTGLSTSTSGQSSSRSPKGQGQVSKFKIFDKIKAVVTNQKQNSDESNIQVGSCSSSATKSSSSSSSSFLNGIKSHLKIGSYSSSPKENSSHSSSSTMPVVMLDITENYNDNPDEVRGQMNYDNLEENLHKSQEIISQKSEGFEVHGTMEFETSQKTESDKSQRKMRNKIQMFNSDKLSVDGNHTLAVDAWKDQLKAEKSKDSPRVAKILHAILYSHLERDELGEAVEFIDGLIFQASVEIAMSSQELPAYDDGSRPPLMTLVTHRSQDSEEEELVPCIRNKSIRKTVQSLARFMAAYFSNQTMYIYPPHSAKALPPVHTNSTLTKSRIIPKYHVKITTIITRDGLSSMWTTERTVEYLLLSGLISETAWFAHKMGDWKTGYLLSVAHDSHQEIAPQLYDKAKKPLQLPSSLSPKSILQEKLQILIQSNRADSTPAVYKHTNRYFIPINQETNIPTLTKTLQDILTAGILSDVELAPWLLGNLTGKLKSVISNLSPLVPQNFYLPAPPLYCPQPGEIEMSRDQPDVQYEREIRMEISSIIQLVLVSLNSANLSLPAARWYIQELFKIQEKAAQFKATTEGPCLELPEILQQYKIFRSDLGDLKDQGNVHEVLTSFRDFCTILWVLHVRDELSLHLRKRGSQLSGDRRDGQESPASTLGHEYVQECFKILKWAVHMVAFSQYIADDGCIRKVILSLILELPATEDTADILAEHFYAAENLDPEVQEKLERLTSSWQSIEIVPEDDGKSARPEEAEEVRQSLDNDEDEDDGSVRKSVTFYQASPRAKTLSMYFHKQCQVVQKVLKKRRKCYGQYEEFVFSLENETDTQPLGMNIAGAICIGSRPFETKQSYLEFLDRFYAICFTKVVEQESESGRRQKHPILMPFSKTIREAEFQAFLSKYEETYQKRQSSVVMASPRAKFFRSQSESHVVDSPSTPQRRSLFRSNSSSVVEQPPHQAAMSRYESEGSLFSKSRPPSSPSRAKPNMTGMASRFFQSEEVLYRDQGDAQDVHWILDVNFGQRYLALQHLLDYLHQWAGKQHSLGLHGKNEKTLGLKPTMRIEVPTQLVVLGLWLLENKYSGGMPKRQENTIEPEAAYELKSEQQSPRVGKSRQKSLATVSEVTEHDSFTQVSNIPRSRSLSPSGPRSRSHSPHKAEVSRSQSAGFDVSRGDRTLDYVKSITTTQEETEQMETAYKKVLNDGDSSSLEVSSLEQDEYQDDTRQSLPGTGSGSRVGRGKKSRHRRRSPQRRIDSSPDSRNNSAFNYTLQFESSPERHTAQTPQTSTPLRGNSPNRRQQGRQTEPADLSRISLPPTGGIHGNTAPPSHYRSGLLGGNPVQTIDRETVAPLQSGAGNPGNMAGLDIAQQLQQIVRGELRRMMEVQHQSMMAMMGALDGQQPSVAWQQNIPANQNVLSSRGGNFEDAEPHSPKGKKPMRTGVLNELKNLQIDEHHQEKRRRSKSSPAGKENIDQSMRMSELRNGENIEVYRISQDGQDGVNFYPNFLRIPAEKDTNTGVRFPHIPKEAWQSQSNFAPGKGVPEMPLLHVDRTVPAHKFPVTQRSHSLPRYQADPSFFHTPNSNFVPAPQQQVPPQRPVESPDSGIGIPLLRLQREESSQKRQPRFGELLPPDQVIESVQEAEEKELLREKYLREYHKLQAEQALSEYKQGFGAKLLHLNLQQQDEEKLSSARKSPKPKITPRKTPSPRKTPRSISEQVSSKASRRSKKKLDSDPEQAEEAELSEKHQPISERFTEHPPMRKGVSDEGEESDEEDDTEAESMEEAESGEEEEPLHDGYAIKQGEFEAYLALENALAKTKDTHARIQLKTALRLQRQRMQEKWKRPKVDFATNTAEQLESGTDPVDFPPEPGYFRYAEKATSITRDTGSDPIQEAVIEYNQSRQANVLPPDIYMGLRFADRAQQPGSDITGQQQDSRGRNYLNVVDLDASAVLNDLRERPEPTEPQLDVSITPEQLRLRNRMAQEEATRVSFEAPVIERPTRADELTVKMFETKMQGQNRVSLAIMPRDSMPDSKYAIMQRLRDMNSQLAAIDHMSNNIEREFKSTRLAINTLEDMTTAMEPVSRHDIDDLGDQQIPERLVESRADSEGRTLTPQHSAKSPTPSVRATARSTARSKKSMSKQDKKEMSVELAKVSGLSGISDIIGDMVAQGEIDLDDVGLSKHEADRLVQRGIIRKEEMNEARISLDEIKKMADTAHHDGARNREDLREWMVNKRHKQMQDYKRHLDELRERETRPFRTTQDNFDQSLTVKERRALADARQESRKASKKASMTQRLDEAQHLLGNILTDKPELPAELPARVATPKRRPGKDRLPVSVRDRSPVKTKTFKKDASPARKPQGILKTREVSQPYVSEYDLAMEGYDSHDLDLEDDWMMAEQEAWQPQPRPIAAQPRRQPPVPVQARHIDVSPAKGPSKKGPGIVPKLKLSLEDVDEEEPLRLQQTGDTTGDLTEYYKAMQAMDVSTSHDITKDVARQQSMESEPDQVSHMPPKTYKVKPFTEIVKVQRPEKTRKKPNKFAMDYVGRLQSVSQSETSRTSARTEITQREREMIYGSKRLPSKRPTETTPRRVKTYTERLQEMKSKEKYSTPVAPRSHYGSSVASTSARPVSRAVKPKHKPMTYVEQLKKLNEGHHKTRVGTATTTLQKPLMKSHKPPHKPKTYAQQLQELQPGKTFTGPPSKRSHKPGPARQRPYRDPYAPVAPDDLDQLEAASVVSGWSMGDDVRHILYDDVESSIAVGQSASYAPSEQVSDYFNDVMGDDYTASVDIDDLVQIADGGSVSSGSMMSFIDWDQVDDLIADVR